VYVTSHRQQYRNAKEEGRLSCYWKNIGVLCVLIVAELEERSAWLLLCQIYLLNQESSIHYIITYYLSIINCFLVTTKDTLMTTFDF
jgi:hypothetical protein